MSWLRTEVTFYEGSGRLETSGFRPRHCRRDAWRRAQDVASTSASRYVITNLGTLRSGTSSGAEAVNNRGEVVGSADTGPRVARLATKVSHAFLWKNGVMRDLGALVRGEPSGAGGINDAGEVVGDANGVRL